MLTHSTRIDMTGEMPAEVRRAVTAIALLRTLRAVRASRRAGRPMPRHQALRLYQRHRSELEPAASSAVVEVGRNYLLEYYESAIDP